MPKTILISRDEVSKLADRLAARGTSIFMKEMPAMASDLRLAGSVLRHS